MHEITQSMPTNDVEKEKAEWSASRHDRSTSSIFILRHGNMNPKWGRQNVVSALCALSMFDICVLFVFVCFLQIMRIL